MSTTPSPAPHALIRESLVMVCTCETAGKVRGKGFPVSELAARLVTGVGWVPTNAMISVFGPIGDTPFGATGDLILVPDPATRVHVNFADGGPPEHWYLGDIRDTDGAPWACCPRNFLRAALADLRAEGGLQLYSAFEQEFLYDGVDDVPGAAYSLDAWRRQGGFGETFVAALRQAGVEPDSFLPEYGARQFEVTTAPALGLASADNAIKVRETARATAFRLGHKVSFTPIRDPKGVGNGVHIHMSLRDANGRPVTHNPSRAYGLSPQAEHFFAGILHHLPALCAVTAPSTVSYIRMTPNRWAPTFAYVADRDREASLRVCPVLNLPGLDAEAQFNLEFRPADAAASPYLALGAIVHAGVHGLRHKLTLPPAADIAAIPPAEREARGIKPLPRSLGEALDLLEATPEARHWFGAVHLDAYLRHKRAELAMLDGLNEASQCQRYAAAY